MHGTDVRPRPWGIARTIASAITWAPVPHLTAHSEDASKNIRSLLARTAPSGLGHADLHPKRLVTNRLLDCRLGHGAESNLSGKALAGNVRGVVACNAK